MEKTLEELCELLHLRRKKIKELKENQAVQDYISCLESEELILKEVKPIIKNAKQGYEGEHIILQYQPRYKRLREFNIELVKEQKWAEHVIEEVVNEQHFDALVAASEATDGKIELDTTITEPERFYKVKEVDVSAVLVKDK